MKFITGKYKIHIIIILMSVASIGLIVLQFYWIDSAYVIQKQSFKENVNNVLTLVSNELEKNELLNYVQLKKNIVQSDTLKFPYTKRFAQAAQNSSRFEFNIDEERMIGSRQDSSDYRFSFDNDVQLMSVIRDRKTNLKTEKINEFYKYDFTDNKLTFKVRAFQNDSIIADSLFVFSNTIPVTEQKRIIEKELKNVRLAGRKHKIETIILGSEPSALYSKTDESHLTGGYLYGFNTKVVEIHDRVDLPQIDSILKTKFNDRNIDIKYKLSVYNSRSNPFIVEKKRGLLTKSIEWQNKAESSQQEESDQQYRVQLFPRDLVSANAFLSVEFSDQDFFIYRQILFPVLISIVLIVIIIVCFAISVLTIFKQKKLSELKNDFINNMTHELKTPISTISLATEGILKTDIINKPEKLSQYGKIIFDENKRLGSHVERILKLSVMESGDIDLNVKTIAAHELIEDVRQIVKLQIDEKGGIIETDFQAEFDQIEADYDHLKNVLINLVDNAIKYTVDKPQVKINTSNTEHAFVLKVTDSGIGISRESQKMIFEKFYRVPTGNVHNVKGYGLGLSYVKAICDMLGATIQVDSEIERGTTFTLSFPYTEQNQDFNE